jgi:hypothetical protein
MAQAGRAVVDLRLHQGGSPMRWRPSVNQANAGQHTVNAHLIFQPVALELRETQHCGARGYGESGCDSWEADIFLKQQS